MDNIILQMKDDGDDEEKQVEAPAAIITNAITGGLFRSKPSSPSLYSKFYCYFAVNLYYNLSSAKCILELQRN